ncbi:DsrE family protein [Erythrobacter rubeus]|uniref:DsrE family protein n=1 Tax=Erythrobacter rubeus TaxID=2760803 RepID=A0ABR8KP14_9SPHN|nr:DsrE family protein [Erythrobacter rubeus]MBD2840723.1 DsrE family protein [Erythrobacter rubeus]
MRNTVTAVALIASAPALAQEPDFSAFATGPIFEEFGPHAPVAGANALDPNAEFRIAFDVADRADVGTRNRTFESAARFTNMHAAAGVPAQNMKLVVVVHGKAVLDLVTDEALDARDMEANASAGMVRAMLDHGIRFVVCGQSASVYGVQAEHLIEGVELELSAMTAHALLQQRGYTVNPF